MKSTFFYFMGSLLLVGGLAACHEKASAPQTPQAGFFVRATKDAAPWAAPGTGTYSKARREFSVLGQAGDAAKAEAFALNFALPAWPQPAPVRALPAAWRVLLGYDALTNSYATADAASLPKVEITRLDTVSKVVEGRFSAPLVREKQWTAKTETMALTDGTFRVHYTTVP
ncbi:hypothetical protein [Hymenobacter bucti]|uniref:Lipoprotein n=1 Tax=Hymenobacter bucti TaxID=1844114 RepID=A0ABW4QSX2_9BACT